MAEIVEVLLRLGGTAHRDMVAQQVALARGGGGAPPPPALKARLEAAFTTRLRLDRSAPDGAALFALPFGEESHRWALAREAEIFLRQEHRPGGR
ncbi:MAG TPA: hypothetical protein PLO65_04615 [Caulobacter sp.]|nr:hypothetical protein [Caulobacter sp.]